MKNKKEKNVWVKRTETFTDSKKAQLRAKELKRNESIADVIVENIEGGHIVSYSVDEWYIEAIKKIGVKL